MMKKWKSLFFVLLALNVIAAAVIVTLLVMPGATGWKIYVPQTGEVIAEKKAESANALFSYRDCRLLIGFGCRHMIRPECHAFQYPQNGFGRI